jgi:hypothetical protein
MHSAFSILHIMVDANAASRCCCETWTLHLVGQSTMLDMMHRDVLGKSLKDSSESNILCS